jgi:hypothetical protein
MEQNKSTINYIVFKVKQWLLRKESLKDLEFFFDHNQTPETVKRRVLEDFDTSMSRSDSYSVSLQKTLREFRRKNEGRKKKF